MTSFRAGSLNCHFTVGRHWTIQALYHIQTAARKVHEESAGCSDSGGSQDRGDSFAFTPLRCTGLLGLFAICACIIERWLDVLAWFQETQIPNSVLVIFQKLFVNLCGLSFTFLALKTSI